MHILSTNCQYLHLANCELYRLTTTQLNRRSVHPDFFRCSVSQVRVFTWFKSG